MAIKRRRIVTTGVPVTGYTAGTMGALARVSLIERVAKLKRDADLAAWEASEAADAALALDDPKVVRLRTD